MTKSGQLLLLSLQEGSVRLEQVLNAEAIFDVAWNQSGRVLAQVDVTGQLILYSFDSRLDQTESMDLKRDSALFVDWDNQDQNVILGHSQGSLSLVDCIENRVTRQFEAHDFEVWVSVFDKSEANLVYSGSDDTLFKAWDLRQDSSCPVFEYKGFDAGVCSIQCHPLDPYLIACGSYDESLRILDKRRVSEEIALIELGGGVWRCEWQKNPVTDRLACACMHNGMKILEFKRKSSLEVICDYTQHESLAYGIDWCPGEDILASCSFYDKSLKLWTF